MFAGGVGNFYARCVLASFMENDSVQWLDFKSDGGCCINLIILEVSFFYSGNLTTDPSAENFTYSRPPSPFFSTHAVGQTDRLQPARKSYLFRHAESLDYIIDNRAVSSLAYNPSITYHTDWTTLLNQRPSVRICIYRRMLTASKL